MLISFEKIEEELTIVHQFRQHIFQTGYPPLSNKIEVLVIR